VVQAEHWISCVCVCVQTTTFEWNDHRGFDLDKPTASYNGVERKDSKFTSYPRQLDSISVEFLDEEVRVTGPSFLSAFLLLRWSTAAASGPRPCLLAAALRLARRRTASTESKLLVGRQSVPLFETFVQLLRERYRPLLGTDLLSTRYVRWRSKGYRNIGSELNYNS